MFALNLIRMFEKNGKRAGQDYGIMGYDNIDFLEYVTPRLTTIDNHVERSRKKHLTYYFSSWRTKMLQKQREFWKQ